MTSTSLSQIPDASMVELTEMSNGMQDYIRASSTESRQAAMDAMTHKGLLNRLFPNEIEREQRRIAVSSMRQLAESKQELLGVYIATQIEIARKRADALIAAQGMDLQIKLARFAAEKIDELNSTINISRERFNKEISPQYDDVEKYMHRPHLYNRALASVDHQVDTYFGYTDTLLKGFTESLNNRVSAIQR